MKKSVFFIFYFMLFFSLSSSVVFYDQGTNVVNTTGDILEEGSIEIYIYDELSGGSLIYNKNVSDAIVNGSWNVKVEPNLEYGKMYYKDYVIEGDNLNFNGSDRLEFQSPLGLINNASFFNFSLIGYCSEGSSIRQVYENGSVVCEEDDSSSSVNLTNYALTNESEVFSENITVLNYGFFGWLGSAFSRVASIFVQNVNTINLTLNGTTIESWNEVNLSAVDTDTQKSASGYLYNDSTTIYLNETMLNDTIDLRASEFGDNSSWNESYADMKYILEIDEGNLNVNYSVYSNNTTWWSSLSSWLSGWFVNNVGQLEFNESKLNDTIDLKLLDADTIWNISGSDYLYNDSGFLDVNNTKINEDVYLNASRVEMNELFELMDWFNSVQSAGRLSGGKIISNGDGTISVGEGRGIIKSMPGTPSDGEECEYETCSSISDTLYISWENVSSLELIDESYNYIYYDGSSDSINTTVDFYSVDFTQDFTLGRAYRTGNDVIVRLCGTNLWNFNRRVQLFGEERFPVERARGMMISETGTRNFALTGGILWAELVNRFTTEDFDSSLSSDNFTYWYRNGTGGWTSVLDVSQVDNLYWDDGTGVLNDLSNNKYGVHWVYEVHDSSVHVVYGRGDYTLSQAQLATPPSSLPGLVNSYATLVGKIIILKSASSFAEVSSPFTVSFSSSVVQNHNDLSGIQGGSVGEYYHLNSSQYTSLQGGITGNFTNGNCWFYYSNGFATSTNCSSI